MEIGSLVYCVWGLGGKAALLLSSLVQPLSNQKIDELKTTTFLKAV
jgi:hypothetical protein